MNAIVEMLISQLEGPLVSQIAQRLGVDPAKASQLMAIAVPILLGVLSHQNGNLSANQTSVTQGISKAAGISPEQAQQLVSIVGPAVKGKLGEHAQEVAPALSSGNHDSIVNAIASLGQKALSGVPANRLM